MRDGSGDVQLEELRKDAQVGGVLASGPVTVVDVRWFGSQAVELTSRGCSYNLLLGHDDIRGGCNKPVRLTPPTGSNTQLVPWSVSSPLASPVFRTKWASISAWLPFLKIMHPEGLETDRRWEERT